jgi:VWFA-related protein
VSIWNPVAALLVCGALASAQEAPVFRSGVNVVLVPVVVRDGDGKAVRNLTRESFELRDSGKRQAIEHFSVEDGGAFGGRTMDAARLPPDAPQRFVAYLFDDVNAEANDLSRSRSAAKKHLASLAPGDRAAIYTTSGTTAQEFTADRGLLAKALDALAPRSPKTGACPDISYHLASSYLERHDRRAGGVIAGLVLQCTPNLPPSVLQQRVQMEARRALAEGERSVRIVISSLAGVIDRMARLPGPRSVVFASPGFISLPSPEEEAHMLDRAVRAGVAIHTLDVRGVYMDTASSALSMEYRRLEQSSQGMILGELAQATGGMRYRNDNDLEAGFRALAAPSDVRYVLGFASSAKDGRRHTLDVSVKGCAGCVLSARRDYYASKAGEAAPAVTGMAAEDVLDTPVDLQIGAKDGGISVTAYLDVSGLSFSKAGDRYTRSVPVLFALFDWNGVLLKTEAKRFEFHLTESERQMAQKHGLPLRAAFEASPGRYLVRVVVADADRKVLASVTRAIGAP